jgi:hypothetical protein
VPRYRSKENFTSSSPDRLYERALHSAAATFPPAIEVKAPEATHRREHRAKEQKARSSRDSTELSGRRNRSIRQRALGRDGDDYPSFALQLYPRLILSRAKNTFRQSKQGLISRAVNEGPFLAPMTPCRIGVNLTKLT